MPLTVIVLVSLGLVKDSVLIRFSRGRLYEGIIPLLNKFVEIRFAVRRWENII